MGYTHFLTKTLDRVSTEMSLHVLAYNLKRVIKILGMPVLMGAMVVAQSNHSALFHPSEFAPLFIKTSSRENKFITPLIKELRKKIVSPV